MNPIIRQSIVSAAASLSLVLVLGCGSGGVEAGIPQDANATAKPSLPPDPSGPDIQQIAKQK